MQLVKAYFNYFTHPRETLQQLLQERSLGKACAGYLMGTLGWVLFFNIADGLSVPLFLLKVILVFVAELTAGYFLASLCGLFLDFFRVKVAPVELFVLIGSAGFIKGLLIAFALISAAMPDYGLKWLAPFALLLVLCLQLGYLARGVHRVYGVSVGRALTAWLVAFVPLFIALALIGIFFLWGIILLV